MNDSKPAYKALIGLSGLFTLGAILTLIPWPQASWPNIIGYSSLCTFAPGATFACALCAGITCTIRNRLVKKGFSPVFIPVFVFVVLTAGLVWSTVVWAGVKAQYTQIKTDTTTSASE